MYSARKPTHVDLGLELLHGLDATRGNDDLTTLDLLTLDTTKKGTHVVTSFTLYDV